MKLVYIIGTYPSLTTTFIDREIRALRGWGVEVQVVSIRRGQNQVSAEQEMLREGVIYLLPVSPFKLLMANLYFILFAPLRYFGTLLYLITRPHRSLKSRLMTFLHFFEGVDAAYVLRSHIFHDIHAHFVDRAATVAMAASRLLGRPYSVTAHARDIYVDPVILPEKLAGARFVATCTAYNKSHLSSIINDANKIRCIYHGMDVERYQPKPRAEGKTLVLSVGQLKEKKGFPYLFEACQLLKEQGYDFKCEIIGEGPLHNSLQTEIERLGLKDTVVLLGAQAHQNVIRKYEEAQVFVLPAVPGSDGDRDGIPNVILEALAMELPVISTQHSGIPEVIESGVNGLLVPVEDANSLAKAIAEVLDNPTLGRSFGERGRKKVMEGFSIDANVGKLLNEFQLIAGEN